MVVSNAVAALAEISVRGTPKALVLKNSTVTKLLNVLNEVRHVLLGIENG